MITLGTLLAVYAIVTHFVLNLFFLVKFLGRARHCELALGEIFHTLLVGIMLKPYRYLLLEDGIKPSFLDELFHCVSILLAICFSMGLTLLVIGLIWSD